MPSARALTRRPAPRFARNLLALLVLGAPACTQEIVVYACDAHADAGSGDAEPGPDADGSRDATGGDAGGRDAGGRDAGGRDATVADPCTSGRFCFVGLVAAATRVSPAEPVRFTADVENTAGVALSFRLPTDAVRFERAPGRPAVVPSEVPVTAQLVDPARGVVELTVRDVPPWFYETTVFVRLEASEAGGPVVSREASVVVRGNVVFTLGLAGGVYALTAAGRLPTTQIPAYRSGQLADMLVSMPRAVYARRSVPELLVYDVDGRNDRPDVLRLEVTAHDVALGTLTRADAQGRWVLPSAGSESNSSVLAELPDGRMLAVQYDFTANPKSHLVVWAADGTLERVVPASTPDEDWRSVAVRSNGDVLVGGRIAGVGQVLRFDPTTWARREPPMIERAPSSVVALLAMRTGVVYVAGTGFILQVSASGATAPVTGLPTSSGAFWRGLARIDDDRVVASCDEGQYLGVVQGRAWAGWLPATGTTFVSSSGGGGLTSLE